MKRDKRRLATALLLCACSTACAQDFHAQGFLEARLPVVDGEDRSWTEGGLGKMRFGDGDSSLQAAGALSLSWQISDSLLAVADLQAHGQTSPQLGVLTAWLRWRPVSTSPWRWSLRAGAFFPPVSLENEGVGWTSRWTLSPSALNSWVGEELRTIGAEARIERRGTHGSFEAGVALFRWNDPAGELIASRGWALGDVTSPLAARVRQPDLHSLVVDSPAPVEFKPFVENDGRSGWHADAQWRSPRGIRLRALRYDNRTEPDSSSHQAGREVFSWQTRFGSVGAEVPLGGMVFAAQGMRGSTIIEPAPNFLIESKFRGAFLLAGWERGAWRPALRYDRFRVDQRGEPEESGHAWTAALNWRPRDSLRMTAEWLRVDSTRAQRLLDGLAPRQREDLLQIMLRYQF